jgi:GTPase SAR1 family protein
MLARPKKSIKERIESLREHLANENPILIDVISSFQELDKVGYSLGLLSRDESFATKIAWWPMVSILGTFSSGKSSFINHFVGQKLQKTGNQAVDDKFTVICYTQDIGQRVLPGLALDADPRFPFYQISEEIEKVASGEGGRVDTYLQLKTCSSDSIRGKILIDSPGFDADQQRNSTLRITDHIIDLSDLVLVFFDARHPEPGAMQDTLEHLVTGTVRRNDSTKLLFILNQIDATAQEDNAEDVIAAWQRALSQCGLASGRFYTIYNEEVAMPIEDESVRERYQSKRDADLGDIYQRIAEVSVERVYRIIGALENVANQIEHKVVPELRTLLRTWSNRVLFLDAIVLIPILVFFLWKTISAGYWQGLSFAPPWLGILGSPFVDRIVILVLMILGVGAFHFWMRKLVAHFMARRLKIDKGVGDLKRAFLSNTRYWRSVFVRWPRGWNQFSRRHIVRAREAADHYVQILNDEYTHPSGDEKKGGATHEATSEATENITSANKEAVTKEA